MDRYQVSPPGSRDYIGLAREGIADNFLTFRARKEHLIAESLISRSEEVTALIESSDVDSLPYDKRWGRYRLRLTKHDVESQRDLLLDLIGRASGTPPPVDE